MKTHSTSILFILWVSLSFGQQHIRADIQDNPSHQASLSSLQSAVNLVEKGEYLRAKGILFDVLSTQTQLTADQQIEARYRMAQTLRPLGELEEAKVYLKQAESILDQEKQPQTSLRAKITYEQAKLAYDLGEFEPALQAIQRSIQLREAELGKGHSSLGPEKLLESDIYREMGDMDKTLESNADARKRFQAVYGAHHPTVAGHHGRIAELHASRPLLRHDQIEKNRFKAVRDMGAVLPDNDPDLNAARAAYAESLLPLKDYRLAEKYARQAFESLTGKPLLIEDGQIELASLWHIPRIEEVLCVWGVVKKAHFFHVETDSVHTPLREANALLQAAIAVIDSQRINLRTPDSWRETIRKHRTIYEEAYHTLEVLHRQMKDQNYLEQAFVISEKWKSYSLQLAVAKRPDMQLTSLPADIHQQEQALKEELGLTYQRLREKPEKRDSLLNRSHQLYQQQKQLQSLIKAQFPIYYRRFYANPGFDFKAFAKALGPDQIAYSYFFVGQFMFIIRLHRGQLISIFWPWNVYSFAGEERSWQKFVGTEQEEPPTRDRLLEGHSLSSKLLFLLPDDCESVLLFPDGFLHNLPFAALLDPRKEVTSTNFPEIEWLIRSVDIEHAFSVDLWLEQGEKAAHESSYVGFAPDVAPDGSKLPPLGFNEDDVKHAAGLFKGQAFIGKEATRKALQGPASNSQILHLAADVVRRDRQAFNSFVQLSPADPDNKLYAHMLFNLTLSNDLVVLGMCQHPEERLLGGNLQEGEGMHSLAQAFRHAGSKNVLSPVWATDDRSAHGLQTLFFEQLATGKSHARSLREAQLAWIDKSENHFAQPYFWAGWCLRGVEPSSKNRIPFAGWLVMVGVGLLGVWYMWKKKAQGAKKAA
ncbi:MAG: CHAT domain-containing protein [Bacteroidota bacterium]